MTKKQILDKLKKIEKKVEKIGDLQSDVDDMATDLLDVIDPEDLTETSLAEAMYELQDALSCRQTGWQVEELIMDVRERVQDWMR